MAGNIINKVLNIIMILVVIVLIIFAGYRITQYEEKQELEKAKDEFMRSYKTFIKENDTIETDQVLNIIDQIKNAERLMMPWTMAMIEGGEANQPLTPFQKKQVIKDALNVMDASQVPLFVLNMGNPFSKIQIYQINDNNIGMTQDVDEVTFMLEQPVDTDKEIVNQWKQCHKEISDSDWIITARKTFNYFPSCKKLQSMRDRI